MGKKGKLAAKSANWKWGEEEQSAFNFLRDRLMSPPILAYPDYERPFVLHVDACASGLGPKKKYCLFPISDRPYQNMCDPNLFYGFPKKKKKKKFFFFFLGNP